ncbi:MAG: hypothetical protein M0Z41_18030 [Peptococcaceae bacterium]|jgi:hypothetical protein|nr:hypothetical protein [Peptococcaceae bacterium]
MPDPICIEVPQVLDFCFQTEPFDVCLPLAVFTPAITACPTGAVASCTLTSATCSEVSRVASTTPGFFNVTFLVSVTQLVTVTSTTGATFSTTNSTSFFKTVTLCAPDGATTICDITTGCGPCICIDDVVCCTFNLCLVIKSVFPVVLSVVGTVLTPTLCTQVSPFPPVCPPVVPTICVNCPPV